MGRYRSAMRVKRQDADHVPTLDDSRPVVAPSSSFMLNNCRECGKYKWVYCHVDLRDGKGPGYVCGRCRREAGDRKTT